MKDSTEPTSATKDTASEGSNSRTPVRRRRDGARTVLQDSKTAFRGLKQKHRTLFESEPKEFRRLVRKAEGLVLGLKRGPKPDPAIAGAAREVAAGTRMEDAFEKRYPDLKEKNQQLYAMVLESFRAKVNSHIRKHPRLKRLRDRHLKGRKSGGNAPEKPPESQPAGS